MDDHKIDVLPQDAGSENTKLVHAFAEAVVAGDNAEADRLRKLALFRPESLMAIKMTRGAEHLRQRGYRTDLADRKYGHGWLDQ